MGVQRKLQTNQPLKNYNIFRGVDWRILKNNQSFSFWHYLGIITTALMINLGEAEALTVSESSAISSDLSSQLSKELFQPKEKLSPEITLFKSQKKHNFSTTAEQLGSELSVNQNTVQHYQRENQRQKSQVPSVNQLSDVQPIDWAFQALQSLVERYGCIAGYADGTFRGNRSLNRYEFAASLNACLTRMTEIIAQQQEEFANSDDLRTVEKLQENFAAELATIRGQVLGLEARTAELEANQFSTTTKLLGFNTVTYQGRTENEADLFPRDGDPETSDPGTSINLIILNYFILDTRFSERSLLRLSLLNITGSTAPRLTNDVRVGTDFFDTNGFVLGDLNYRFLIGDRFAGYFGPINVNAVTAFRGPNRIESSVTGPLSFFAQRNPIINIGFGQTGFGFDWQFADRISLQAVYSSNIRELFSKDGHNTTAVQLAITPIDPVDLAIYYINDYSPDGSLFSFVGDEQLTAKNPITGQSAALQTNAVGATLNWQISPKLTLGGWFGYTSSYIPGKSGRVETTNYMVFMNFPDLFREGNLGGIYVGQPPKITHSNLPDGNNIPDSFDTGKGQAGDQPGSTTHVEVFYRFQVTRNLSIMPTCILIFEPGHSPDSETIGVGAIRTTFVF